MTYGMLTRREEPQYKHLIELASETEEEGATFSPCQATIPPNCSARQTATMLEESEPRPQTGFDPSMNRHRPSSEKTQDISHLLASIFKDLYTTEIIGKDTVAILTKTRRGSNNYHDKYVEDLQQVHSEYSRRMRDADMLENHIIQARVQAHGHREQGPHQGGGRRCGRGLPTAGSASSQMDLHVPPELCFPRLIAKPPNGVLQRHICAPLPQSPQDDGYKAPSDPSPREDMPRALLEESETSLTLTCSSDTCTPTADLTRSGAGGASRSSCKPPGEKGARDGRSRRRSPSKAPGLQALLKEQKLFSFMCLQN
ncbi:hypothetical protein J4Q44_G00368170 [Coregonus suidteri]|uniref:Uncharacterized protein n=1 Tax=Coregonus suidteri TaxID=861788 RepID=A0AAN8QB77_9TELE